MMDKLICQVLPDIGGGGTDLELCLQPLTLALHPLLLALNDLELLAQHSLLLGAHALHGVHHLASTRLHQLDHVIQRRADRLHALLAVVAHVLDLVLHHLSGNNMMTCTHHVLDLVLHHLSGNNMMTCTHHVLDLVLNHLPLKT